MRPETWEINFDYWEKDRGILRMYQISEREVTVYEFVFNDKTKKALIRKRPATRDELVMLLGKFMSNREMFRKISGVLALRDGLRF